MNESRRQAPAVPNSGLRSRRPWQTPTVKTVGLIGDVLQGGGGKLAISAADTGDVRKPPGQA